MTDVICCPAKAEPIRSVIRPTMRRLLAQAFRLLHTDAHGHRPCLRDLWKEPEDDQTVAVPRHGDTPPPGQTQEPRG
jgi:hypothetical protein